MGDPCSPLLLALPYARATDSCTPVKRSDAVLFTDSCFLIPIPTTLFDTGSSHFSFISPTFSEKHPSLLPVLLSSPTHVRLGDDVTTISITHSILATIAFDVGSRRHSGTIQFYVFQSGYDVIIGLPDIINHFPAFLAGQLLHAAGLLEAAKVADAATFSNIFPFPPSPTDVPLSAPWTLPNIPDAPEELSEVPPAGAYLNVPYETHVRKFFQSLDSHMGNIEFSQRPLIRQALYEGGFLDIFIPLKWHGIYPEAAPHILPIELKTLDTLPPFMKPKIRPIPPKLAALFIREFLRMCSYFYRSHSGPYASPVLAASKDPTPEGDDQIRVAGDFRGINVHICKNHEPLPDALATATKISKFRYLFDIDARNGFHQLPLGPRTQDLLSVQTPTQQLAPLFLPEGVGPASHLFQKVMSFIFKDFVEAGWCFILIDNIALGANTLDEAEHHLLALFQRCRESGVVLKFEKSHYCQDVVTFFGFEIGHGWVRMSASRKQALLDIPMPTSLTTMKSFLGSANFFLPFVPNYNIYAARLHDTTRKSFDWNDPSTLQLYKEPFEILKTKCADSMDRFTPDYNLEFLVRCDACFIGIGGNLLMRLPPDHPTHPGALVPLAFFSRKFSDVAQRWSTIEQEAYAIYYAVCIAFRMFLYGKEFVLETDHANLLYIEKSPVPKIIRWRLQLQDFVFTIRHIPGKLNTMADYLSRLNILALTTLPTVPSDAYDLQPFTPTNTSDSTPPCTSVSLYALTPTPPPDELQQAFDIVHSARSGHHGTDRTYQLFTQRFPGVHIPFTVIAEMVRQCPWCQKLRATMNIALRPVLSHLETTLFPNRGWVGVDILGMPVTERGNCKLVVFVVHDTKLADLYPTPNEEAITVARCAYMFLMNYGRFRGFATDPGSCFTSHVMKYINDWMGMGHKLSLVDRHESNGVEGTNRLILRHIRALTMVERAAKIWDQPEYVATVKHVINTTADTEYGASPHELTFGSLSMLYFGIPEARENISGFTTGDRLLYLQNLNNCLKIIREESAVFHQSVLKERAKDNLLEAERPVYSPGDLVLAIANPRSRVHKLTPQWLGPHRVISQSNSDVVCRQVATGEVRVFHVTRLILYSGADDETAFQLACRDDEQHKLRGIKAYRGDPIKGRRYCTFLVEFSDGETSWIQYGPDLCNTEAFETYCISMPELKILLLPTLKAVEFLQEARTKVITRNIAPDCFYIDLRVLSFTWYDSLSLPNSDELTYVVEANFSQYTNKKKTRAEIDIPLFGEKLRNLDHYWFEANAYRTQLTTSVIHLDRASLLTYPQLLDTTRSIPKQDEEFPPLLAGTPANRQGKYQRIVSAGSKLVSKVSQPRTEPRPSIEQMINVPPRQQPEPLEHNDTTTQTTSQLRRRSPRLGSS